MFFALFSNFFTDILKINELPKVHNKILPKYRETLVITIINYQANSMLQLYLDFEPYSH